MADNPLNPTKWQSLKGKAASVGRDALNSAAKGIKDTNREIMKESFPMFFSKDKGRSSAPDMKNTTSQKREKYDPENTNKAIMARGFGELNFSIQKVDKTLQSTNDYLWSMLDKQSTTNSLLGKINSSIQSMGNGDNQTPSGGSDIPSIAKKTAQARDARGRFQSSTSAAPAAGNMSRFTRWGGRALGPLSAGIAGAGEYMDSGNAGRAASVAGGAALGGWGGAAAGAALGTAILPGFGTIAGGLLGGFAGGTLGSSVGRSGYDSITRKDNDISSGLPSLSRLFGGETVGDIASGVPVQNDTNTISIDTRELNITADKIILNDKSLQDWLSGGGAASGAAGSRSQGGSGPQIQGGSTPNISSGIPSISNLLNKSQNPNDISSGLPSFSNLFGGMFGSGSGSGGSGGSGGSSRPGRGRRDGGSGPIDPQAVNDASRVASGDITSGAKFDPKTGLSSFDKGAVTSDPSRLIPMQGNSSSNGGPLGNTIAQGESVGRGYNAYNRGTAGQGKEHIDFSQMTLGEVMAMQKNRQVFAVGKYQTIPSTLAEAAKALNLDPNQKFTPELQERIFRDHLISTKRPDIKGFITGKHNDVNRAIDATAREWAGVKGSNGRGFYDGDSAGNGASVSPEATAKALNEARAKYAEAKAQGKSDQEAFEYANGVTQKKADPNMFGDKKVNPLGVSKVDGKSLDSSLFSGDPMAPKQKGAGEGVTPKLVGLNGQSKEQSQKEYDALHPEVKNASGRFGALGEGKYTITSTTSDGHSSGSQHYNGRAIDVRITDAKSPEELQKRIEDLRKAGFNKIGISGNHLHAEVNPNVKKGQVEVFSESGAGFKYNGKTAEEWQSHLGKIDVLPDDHFKKKNIKEIMPKIISNGEFKKDIFGSQANPFTKGKSVVPEAPVAEKTDSSMAKGMKLQRDSEEAAIEEKAKPKAVPTTSNEKPESSSKKNIKEAGDPSGVKPKEPSAAAPSRENIKELFTDFA